jgi:type IV secretory pathway VirB2 component (pilin)
MSPDFQSAPDGVIAAALQWIEGTLLGSLVTAIAIIAIASVGFLLLQGRIEVCRGSQVIFGCFILFGASSIAAGIIGAVRASEPTEFAASEPSSSPLAQTAPVASTPYPAASYDPYAGAALPRRR